MWPESHLKSINCYYSIVCDEKGLFCVKCRRKNTKQADSQLNAYFTQTYKEKGPPLSPKTDTVFVAFYVPDLYYFFFWLG
jgi:uncharacterized protein YecT (DUF1311 family)